jgi:hypothetical protein
MSQLRKSSSAASHFSHNLAAVLGSGCGTFVNNFREIELEIRRILGR